MLLTLPAPKEAAKRTARNEQNHDVTRKLGSRYNIQTNSAQFLVVCFRYVRFVKTSANEVMQLRQFDCYGPL